MENLIGLEVTKEHVTKGNVTIYSKTKYVDYESEFSLLKKKLDSHEGMIFKSSIEIQGKYELFDFVVTDIPIVLESKSNHISFLAKNDRGVKLLRIFKNGIDNSKYRSVEINETSIHVELNDLDDSLTEEQKIKEPSLFGLLDDLINFFSIPNEPALGFFGVFGFDHCLHVNKIELKKPRHEFSRDTYLCFPDQVFYSLANRRVACVINYDFSYSNGVDVITTVGVQMGNRIAYSNVMPYLQPLEISKEAFVNNVERAISKFKKGELYEVVLSQSYFHSTNELPSSLFERLTELNPSPYEFFVNMGEGEFLIGSSPEMYLKKKSGKVLCSPISGTVKRGVNAFDDSERIRSLLNSNKDRAELSMCTDVIRNDLARVCDAGSVKVVSHRSIEIYNSLIHTVDSIEGVLSDDFSGLDCFKVLCWLVTLTGAPKYNAIQFIEDTEFSSRNWYGGVVAQFGLNGDINSGVIIRTMSLRDDQVELRSGSTLLAESVPEKEYDETVLKMKTLNSLFEIDIDTLISSKSFSINSINILMIDHNDSFVHLLSSYFKSFGASVTTYGYSIFTEGVFNENLVDYDLAILSPGPGKPSDYRMSTVISMLIDNNIPIFGVCLGFQGIVEYYGGVVSELVLPRHGIASELVHNGNWLFSNLPKKIIVGRYHSLFAKDVPISLNVTSTIDGGIPMSVEHKVADIWGVQFHPESILSSNMNSGKVIIENIITKIFNLKMNDTRRSKRN